MLNESIKTLRKAKGFTQEDFAARLNVVRQTVSKWEKGLSVPDSETLVKISELLEVSVGDLLGAKIPENIEQPDIARQLERVNEQLVIKNRRSKLITKIVLGVIIGIAALHLLLIGLSLLFGVQYGQPDVSVTQSAVLIS